MKKERSTTSNGLGTRASILIRYLFYICVITSCATISVQAFPPTPHHIIYGLVRDEMGNPLTGDNAKIILETSTGTKIKADVIPFLDAGVNYRLKVPMDAGLTTDAYKPTALKTAVGFRLKVVIGSVTYLPIEMTGNLALLGQPAKTTRLNLTLGEDLDGDGIPDAWERAMIAALGLDVGISGFKPGDKGLNGLSYKDSYQAGLYPFDPDDGFKLDIVGATNGVPQMEFLAIRGRAYTLYGSTDMKTWLPVQFKVPSEGATPVARSFYQATDVRQLRIEAIQPNGTQVHFFKLLVQ